MQGLYLYFFNFLYVVLLILVYFSKERLKSHENNLFVILLISSAAGSLLHVLSIFSLTSVIKNNIINIIITKGYTLYLLLWDLVFSLYVYTISFKKDSKLAKALKLVSIFLSFVCLIAILIFPLHYYVNGSAMYTYGIPTLSLYILVFIFGMLWICCLFANRKNIKDKKFFPLIIMIIGGGISVIIQLNHPEILLITAITTIVVLIMYHTIENPDLALIEQLNAARDEANRANQAKSEFLSNMSHEIRTPLNAIVGFSQALETEDLPQEAKEEVGDIISASESLLEIVNGILDISKIEANKLDIINTEYSFRKVFKELINLTKARMGDSKLEFRYSMDESIPQVLYGDHARVKQVILNLLTNAVKYTKEGYLDFTVSSVVQGDICRLIISVEDSGIGIKKEALGKLFSKFERLGVEKEITIEGTGLGLAITKKLVELMKGEIVVQSIYGKGSRFTIALDQRIVLGKDSLFEEKDEELKLIDCTGKNILVVDDNPVNLKVAKRLLMDYKANITLIGSGFEAIDNIKAGNTYDLILMDDMMPKMNGTETMKKLHELEGFNIPVIALTANAISGMKEKYINDGFDDYLPKPIQKIELNQVIDKFLGQNK